MVSGHDTSNFYLHPQFPMSTLRWGALFKFLREVWIQHGSGAGMIHHVDKLQSDNNTSLYVGQWNRVMYKANSCLFLLTYKFSPSLPTLAQEAKRITGRGRDSQFPSQMDPLHSGIWANILLYIKLNVFCPLHYSTIC